MYVFNTYILPFLILLLFLLFLTLLLVIVGGSLFFALFARFNIC